MVLQGTQQLSQQCLALGGMLIGSLEPTYTQYSGQWFVYFSQQCEI